MTEEKKLTPAEWGKQLGRRRRMLGVPGAMRGASIPMDKPITQAEFERAMNKWRKKPAHRLAQPAPPPAPAKSGTGLAGDLSVVETADPAPAESRQGGEKAREKGGKK